MYYYKLGYDSKDENKVIYLSHQDKYSQIEFDNIVFHCALLVAEEVKNLQQQEFENQQKIYTAFLNEAIRINDVDLIAWYEHLINQEFSAEITFSSIYQEVSERMSALYGFEIITEHAGCFVFGFDNLANPVDEFGQRPQDLFLSALVDFFQKKIYVNSSSSTNQKLVMNPQEKFWLVTEEIANSTDITNEDKND